MLVIWCYLPEMVSTLACGKCYQFVRYVISGKKQVQG